MAEGDFESWDYDRRATEGTLATDSISVAGADSDCSTGAAQDVSLFVRHIATEHAVEFKKIKVTGFSDNITTSWNEEAVYGRMDPIATYQGSTRAIELTFELGPYTESSTRRKMAMAKIQRLMQFQYPTYANVDNVLSISRPPLIEVRFMNLIKGNGDDGTLLCYMSGMSFSPTFGMAIESVPRVEKADILPQRFSVSLGLKVLHTQPPGWDENAHTFYNENAISYVDIGEAEFGSTDSTAGVEEGFGLPEAEAALLSEEEVLDPGAAYDPATGLGGYGASTANLAS